MLQLAKQKNVKELALVSLYPEKNLNVIREERKETDYYTENSLLVGCDNIPDNSKLMKLGWNAVISIDKDFRNVIDYYKNKIVVERIELYEDYIGNNRNR